LHSAGQSAHSLPRHFHEELELNIKQGNGWQFNYRGTTHNVPANTLVITQQGEAHQADSTDNSSGKSLRQRDYTFRGLRIGLDLLQQVAIEVAGRETDLPFFPLPLVHDRDLTDQNVSSVKTGRSIESSQKLALTRKATLVYISSD
jgi:hypothetical protein